MDIQKFRGYFPYIKTGKIYFACASTGPLSSLVIEALNEYLYVRSVTKIDDFTTFLKIYASVKESLAQMINGSADRIAFLDNTTNGINVLANGIKWNKGDRILLNDLEFPANVYPFINLEKYGVEVDIIPTHDGNATAEDIIRAVKPQTKLISVSQVQFLTGYRVDLEKIGNYCKENNILFSVDAIQGLGAVTLDVKRSSIDFLSCGTQKWMLGLQGLSFIYVNEALQKEMVPGQVGWLSVNDAWNILNYDLKLKSTAECFETGTVNTIGIYALEASLRLFNEAGFDEIEKRVLDNTQYMMEKLKELKIIPYLANQERKYLSGIISFKHPRADIIFKQLLKNNIVASLREGMIRLAPHFYTIKEDIDKVINVLKEMKDDSGKIIFSEAYQ